MTRGLFPVLKLSIDKTPLEAMSLDQMAAHHVPVGCMDPGLAKVAADYTAQNLAAMLRLHPLGRGISICRTGSKGSAYVNLDTSESRFSIRFSGHLLTEFIPNKSWQRVSGVDLFDEKAAPPTMGHLLEMALAWLRPVRRTLGC